MTESRKGRISCAGEKDYSQFSIRLVKADSHGIPEDATVLEDIAIPAERTEAFLTDVQKLATEKYGVATFDELLASDLSDDSTAAAKQEQREKRARREKGEAVKESNRGKVAIVGAAICLVLVAALAINHMTPSGEAMQLGDISSVLYAASISEVKEEFPDTKVNEKGDLEIEGNCGEAAGTYTIYLESNAPYLASFTPVDLNQNDLVKGELEAQFGGHDGYNARLQYFEYNDSTSNLLIKYYPSSGVYFYSN